MDRKRNPGRAWLMATAKVIALNLQKQSDGTALRVRIPKKAYESDTGGWCTVIGDLGKGRPRLEIWFDRFSGYTERKLYAGFSSWDAKPIRGLTKNVSMELWPVRTVTDSDLDETKDYYVLRERLVQTEFNAPFVENYSKGDHFFGFYDPTRESQTRINPHFCERAVAFFLDVASVQLGAAAENGQHDVYPQCENRKPVAAHLRRERSRLLAVECKIRDDYRCQVCGFNYEEVYGEKLGAYFAEAHHIRHLKQSPDQVKTRLEDLTTVCANCHRMLHRMKGTSHDVASLRAIVGKLQ